MPGTLIQNSIIVDGTKTKPFHGSILIEDDTIIAVEKNSIAPPPNTKIIDAKNSYLTPGFIDVHSHADYSNFTPGDLRPKISQGITTEIVGQCGFSPAPMPPANISAWRQVSIIDDPRTTSSWENLAAYLAALRTNGLESNLVPFVGHITLRCAVAGAATRPLTTTELQQLEKLAAESFAAGAAGLSFGLIYNPAMFAEPEEIEILVKTAAKYNKIVSIHLRSESNELIEAIQEILTICQKHQAKLHISHCKAIGKSNWHKLDTALEIISANNLTFDHYPYIAGATTLMTIFPPEIFTNLQPGETIFTRLTQPAMRQKLKQLFAGAIMPTNRVAWDNLPALVGWDKIIVTTAFLPQHQAFIGLSVQAIADRQNKHPSDAVIDLVAAENGKVFMLDFYAEESSILKKLQHPNGVIGSDSDMVAIGKHHPRVYGNFPRVLREYVFKQVILPLEIAIAKMTSQSASIFGLRDRGKIAPGYKADLLIFSRDFKDNATFDDPEQLATGLEYVFINGQLKIDRGVYLPNKPGKVLH